MYETTSVLKPPVRQPAVVAYKTLSKREGCPSHSLVKLPSELQFVLEA